MLSTLSRQKGEDIQLGKESIWERGRHKHEVSIANIQDHSCPRKPEWDSQSKGVKFIHLLYLHGFKRLKAQSGWKNVGTYHTWGGLWRKNTGHFHSEKSFCPGKKNKQTKKKTTTFEIMFGKSAYVKGKKENTRGKKSRRAKLSEEVMLVVGKWSECVSPGCWKNTDRYVFVHGMCF